jgi:hypothetical protein
MKKIFSCLAILFLLSACAASSFKTARENANKVTNGMTVKEASAVLGMGPTNITPDYAQWQRGNVRVYDATRSGAVEYKLRNGVIFGIPPGGIFGTEAKRIYDEEIEAAYKAHRAATDAALAERKKRDDLQAEEDRKRAEADRKHDEENKKLRLAAYQAEAKASQNATVTCSDKVMCGKIFALSQIFVAQNADQKIQVATDTVIQTYNPSEGGKLGASITKTPQRGTTEVVTVVPSCNDDLGIRTDLCIARRTAFYNNFRSFIDENLKK